MLKSPLTSVLKYVNFCQKSCFYDPPLKKFHKWTEFTSQPLIYCHNGAKNLKGGLISKGIFSPSSKKSSDLLPNGAKKHISTITMRQFSYLKRNREKNVNFVRYNEVLVDEIRQHKVSGPIAFSLEKLVRD